MVALLLRREWPGLFHRLLIYRHGLQISRRRRNRLLDEIDKSILAGIRVDHGHFTLFLGLFVGSPSLTLLCRDLNPSGLYPLFDQFAMLD